MHTIAPKSILVVDDEPSVGDAFYQLLSMERHRVEAVGDGQTALARCNQVGFDLVIADFLMPGMDGLELARLIKQRAPHMPVVLVTAFPETLLRSESARLTHVDAMLAKPFSLDHLHEVLGRVFPGG